MKALLDRRLEKDSYRSLQVNEQLVDFCSNDYLSLSQNMDIAKKIHKKSIGLPMGSTGSRLLTGHYKLIDDAEQEVAAFHQADTALIFNSGYSANLGILSSIPRKSDIILYDELVHASIHDGMRLSAASSYSFRHNNLSDLEKQLKIHQSKNIFVFIESIYSMNGDEAPLIEIAELCKKNNALLIVDEAHSSGVCGKKGEGLCVEKGIEDAVFARLHTFGKAIGLHAAAVVGSKTLRDYLINFSRPLIYTTAINPHTALSILETYKHLNINGAVYVKELKERIDFYKLQMLTLSDYTLKSNSAIQCLLIPGNTKVLKICTDIKRAGFDIRAIRSPTVAAGRERIRICIHRHNSLDQIGNFTSILKKTFKQKT